MVETRFLKNSKLKYEHTKHSILTKKTQKKKKKKKLYWSKR